MRLSISDATALVQRTICKAGYNDAEAAIVTDHLIDAELRGLGYAGLARALSVLEKIESGPDTRAPIKTVRETPVSALIDGGGHAGYLVGHRATSIAIEKAKQNGIGIIGAYNTWYTGMFAYYMEMATKENLVAMAAGSSAWRVAPYGSSEGRFGTNPLAFGFPSTDDPIILDFGTAAIMVSETTQHKRAGTSLPYGRAFDAEGNPTADPVKALSGAFSVWGGAKGSGLALSIQLFGLLCNGAVVPPASADCSLFMMVMRPDLLVPAEQLKAQVAEYAQMVREARRLDASEPVRMPFDRSAATRKESVERGWIDVPDYLHAKLVEAAPVNGQMAASTSS